MEVGDTRKSLGVHCSRQQPASSASSRLMCDTLLVTTHTWWLVVGLRLLWRLVARPDAAVLRRLRQLDVAAIIIHELELRIRRPDVRNSAAFLQWSTGSLLLLQQQLPHLMSSAFARRHTAQQLPENVVELMCGRIGSAP